MLRSLVACSALALTLLLAGCQDDTSNPSASASPPASTPTPTPLIADSCLVGTWTLVGQTSTTTSAQLSGFSGARMTITATGLETTDYTTAQPESGVVDGSRVVGTRHGQWVFQDSVATHLLIRTAVSSSILEIFVINGASPTPAPVKARPVSTFTYACTATQMTWHVASNDATGSFSALFQRVP